MAKEKMSIEEIVAAQTQRQACLIRTSYSEQAIRDRTNKILNRERFGNDEFNRLHAILCMTHSWDCTESLAFDNFIDTGLIAARIDELREEAMAD